MYCLYMEINIMNIRAVSDISRKFHNILGPSPY